jgi:hypothetical protein
MAPTVYGIEPATCQVAGTPAVISGPSGLAATTGVTFGVLPALAWSVFDDSTLYVTAPAQAAGVVDVTVHTTAGDVVVPGGLDYQAPANGVVDWPTLPEVRAFLRKDSADTGDDPVIDTCRVAAIDYANRRTAYRWIPGASASWLTPLPDVVHQAAVLHASRLYRRRDSIDGTVGWADVGLTHVGRVDPDVEAAYASVGPLVFG